MAALTLNLNETVTVKDEIRSKAKGVISSVSIKNTDLTFADFSSKLSVGSPPGFEDFSKFIVGDYSYSKALFKATTTASQASSPRITSLQVAVDVPDLFDRGTATTSATGVVTVNYAKSFKVITEVVATLKGGTTPGMVRISSITATSFGIELIDVTGARIVGTVSWAARGY